ncbi:hypothetical protein Hden_0172 [Hyphomicrobium denitrificans ATCC 51888]|uniref:Uncharacterized protein n=1 Tax=Hyphomicrobium denitrificans (strain ATCC 51888 / DSM 1869 / NCIMB 11706 / TK 0415) TaxID=582899 RepID=D8JQ77_HYPDA|nr:DUF2793 domain-containing protein [Hyphomicrobium denitrificans]ADJ21998.1 hypothetical protein Hden_0172 [Hyphomicrobium denitrificans ATCC 51888]
MTDSTYVFPPGERITDDSTGAPISGATIYFYDAQTTNAKTVYADADLTASLGTSVVTDSQGYPTTNGITRTLIYVGTAPYKIVIKDSSSNTIATHDNIPGAVVSASSSDVAVTASFPVVTKSLNYTVVKDDQNSLFKINCSSGDVTLTLPSAVAMGNGWCIRVQHAGSANQAILATVSSQLISEGSKSFSTGYALALNGEDIELRSDGGNWSVVSHTSPFIKVAQGIIPITDRLSAPPVSPQHGAFYLLTSSPSGAWSTFSQHDIVQYHGGSAAWVNFTPYTDCGWFAYVADENLNYQFRDSAWVPESATNSVAGTVKTASQAVQETSTATDTAVTPATQQFHPSSPKWWLEATVSGGTPTVVASYNNTSITDANVGVLTATIATDFSSANWACHVTCRGPDTTQGRAGWVYDSSQSAGAITGLCYTLGSSSPSNTDPTAWYLSGLGDQ